MANISVQPTRSSEVALGVRETAQGAVAVLRGSAREMLGNM